jgi:hypothetical protein
MPADQFTREACALAIRKMFTESHFSICTVDRCLEALRITPIKAQYDALRAVHCVHYSTMTPAFREELLIRTMALFADGSTFDLGVIERGFMVQQSPDVGRVVSIQSSPAAKRSFLGLGFGRQA